MSATRAKSSPDLIDQPSTVTTTMPEQFDDSALEGVAANIKLLLKLIQDHKDACNTHKNDGRRMLRVAGMMTILDMVRTRIQKCQSFGNKRSAAELRRCNTDLRPHHNVPKDKRLAEPIADEKERLRKELNASLAARKSLEIMCSSLGKEKEIMAAEIARKVHEMSELEEDVNDLRAQNESLLEKVQECAAEHKGKNCGGVVEAEGEGGEREVQGNAALQERNMELSEQLLRSLDGYRAMKRKLRDVLEENMAMRATMEEMGVKVSASLERIRSFKQHTRINNEEIVDIEEEISELEHMFECFDMKVPRHGKKKGECAQPNGDQINACKPVFA